MTVRNGIDLAQASRRESATGRRANAPGWVREIDITLSAARHDRA